MRAGVFAFAGLIALGAVAGAPRARADEADIRRIVQEELKAAADKKKKDEGSVVKVQWKEGLKFESNDKKFKMHIGGRAQLDAAFYDDDDYVDAGGSDQKDGVKFRRIRLEASGEMYKHAEFKVQLDFADDKKGKSDDVEVALKDVYMGLKNLKDCWGCAFPNIRVGHFKEPFSLEELTSSKYISFMERALPNVFAPSRNVGFMLHDSLRGGQLNYGVGLFATTDDGGEASIEEGDDGMAFTARVGWTPWYDCTCPCNRFHIGASYSHRFDLGSVRFRQRPEISLRDRLVDTGSITADGVDLFGVEAALVYGPLSVQGEWMQASVDSDSADDPSFSGWYVFASYFLTGECRPYSKGTFGRVKPCCNFLDNECCCKGALEVLLRYSTLDLDDQAIAGGEEANWTVGLNWYLNPNMRVMANYVIADVERGAIDETLHIFGLRFAVDF